MLKDCNPLFKALRFNTKRVYTKKTLQLIASSSVKPMFN